MRAAPIPQPGPSLGRRIAIGTTLALLLATMACTCWVWSGRGTTQLTFEQAMDAVRSAEDVEHVAAAATRLRRMISEAATAIDRAGERLPAARERLARTKEQITKVEQKPR